MRQHLGIGAEDVAGKRIGGAEIVGGRKAQERIEIAYGGEADTVDRRILGRIHELVDIGLLERRTGGQQADMRLVHVFPS